VTAVRDDQSTRHVPKSTLFEFCRQSRGGHKFARSPGAEWPRRTPSPGAQSRDLALSFAFVSFFVFIGDKVKVDAMATKSTPELATCTPGQRRRSVWRRCVAPVERRAVSHIRGPQLNQRAAFLSCVLQLAGDSLRHTRHQSRRRARLWNRITCGILISGGVLLLWSLFLGAC